MLLLFISASQGNLFAEIIECIKIDNLYYDLNTETGCATVRDKETGYHASSYYGGTYVIPECVEHNNQKFVVTAIAEYTFCKAGNSKHVLYVTLPKTLRKIGRSAFKYALGLFSIVIPEGITTLPDAVFSDCENLRSVKLPSTLTTIESSAFYGCYLTEITFPQSLKSIGAYAFAYHGFDETIIFPHGLQSIGQRAFYTNRGGDGYVYIIPKSVTSIGELAFYEINTSRRFYVQWDTPIDLSGSIVCNDGLTSVRVPCGTKELYAAADYWKNYGIYEQCIDNSTLYNIEATAVNGTIKGTGQYPYGSYVTLTAVPAEGYRFSQWSDGVICNPRTEAVTANATYTAEFIEAGNIDPTWQILYTSSDGNVVTPYSTDVFGANIVSNEYIEGQGVITFDGPVTQIGERAFYNCSSLTSITIPSSVTSLGYAAFFICPSLTTITIPESVTSLGEGATFQQCTALKNVYWNAIDCTIEQDADGYYYPPFLNLENIEEFVFGADVTTIPAYLCQGLTGLKSLTIPESVTSIGRGAFLACSSLISVTIPESVTSLGEGATFQQCTALKNVYWNAIDCTIEQDADGYYYPPFLNLENIEEFVFGADVTTIPAYLCRGLTGLKSLTIPESVTSIGEGAFLACSSLISVTIPESVTSIGEGATFQQCTALKNVYWNAIDCTIEQDADGTYYPPFYNLENIEEFVFGVDVTTIPAFLCDGLTGLKSLTIPESVTSIGKYAFKACSKLTSITIPNSVINIERGAFRDCSSLTTITIPESVKSLGEGATFQQCTALKNVYWNAIDCTIEQDADGYYYPPFLNLENIEEFVFGADVTTIPASLCQGLTGLKSLTIPESVTSIGNKVFRNCSSLTSVRCNATTPPALGTNVFDNIDNTIPVYVPCGSVSAYKAADLWNYFTNFQASEQFEMAVHSNNDTWGQVFITQPTIPYVGFTATADNSTICMRYGGTLVGAQPKLQYSYDAQIWNTFVLGTTYDVANGQTFYMRGHNPNGVSIRFDGYSYFIMEGSFEGSGNIMSLIDTTCTATEVPAYCFYRLFYYCTSLTKSPDLTATKLNYNCYANMFVGCTNLQYIEVDFTKWNTEATENWVSSIASTGTFVKPAALPTTFGSSNIPSGWTVMDKEENDGSTSNVTSGTYECETTLILTATPNDCYQFIKWSDGNTDNPRTIVVNEDATYTAEFMPIPYTITVESTDESQGSVQVEIN